MARYSKSSANYRNRRYKGRGSSYRPPNRTNSQGTHNYRGHTRELNSYESRERRGYNEGLSYKPSRNVPHVQRRPRDIRKTSRTTLPKVSKQWGESKKLPRAHIEADTERMLRQLEEPLQEEEIEKLIAEIEKITGAKDTEKFEQEQSETRPQSETELHPEKQPQTEGKHIELEERGGDNILEPNPSSPEEPEGNYPSPLEASDELAWELEQTEDLEQLLDEIEPFDDETTQEAEIFPEILPEPADEELEDALEAEVY